MPEVLYGGHYDMENNQNKRAALHYTKFSVPQLQFTASLNNPSPRKDAGCFFLLPSQTSSKIGCPKLSIRIDSWTWAKLCSWLIWTTHMCKPFLLSVGNRLWKKVFYSKWISSPSWVKFWIKVQGFGTTDRRSLWTGQESHVMFVLVEGRWREIVILDFSQWFWYSLRTTEVQQGLNLGICSIHEVNLKTEWGVALLCLIMF